MGTRGGELWRSCLGKGERGAWRWELRDDDSGVFWMGFVASVLYTLILVYLSRFQQWRLRHPTVFLVNVLRRKAIVSRHEPRYDIRRPSTTTKSSMVSGSLFEMDHESFRRFSEKGLTFFPIL